MSLPPPPHESFKTRLRQAIDRQGLTIAGLARRLDPERPERAERNLYRWLSPTSTMLPSRVSRKALARALGCEPDFFSPKTGKADVESVEFLRLLLERRQEALRREAWLVEA